MSVRRSALLAVVALLGICGCGGSDADPPEQADSQARPGSSADDVPSSDDPGVAALCLAAGSGDRGPLEQQIRGAGLTQALELASLLGDWLAAVPAACLADAERAATIVDEVYAELGAELEVGKTLTTEPPAG